MKLSRQRSTTVPDHIQRCTDVQAHNVHGQVCILEHTHTNPEFEKHYCVCRQLQVPDDGCKNLHAQSQKMKSTAMHAHSHTSSFRKNTAVNCAKIQGQRCPASTCSQSQMRSAFQVRNVMQSLCQSQRCIPEHTHTNPRFEKQCCKRGMKSRVRSTLLLHAPKVSDVHPCASLHSPWSKNALLYMPTMSRIRGTQVYMSTKSRVRGTKKNLCKNETNPKCADQL